MAVEPEFATRFVQLPPDQNNGESSLADPVELDGWVDSATVLGQQIFEQVDERWVYRDPEPVVELCPGRSEDEAVLDLHSDFLLRRVVLRRTGAVGSVLFDAVRLLATKASLLEAQLASTALSVKEREAELTRLNEQLALERARQFGASSEQKLPESDQPAAPIEPPQEPPVPEPAKKLRLAASGGGRKPLADHIPREDVRHQLEPEARVCKTCQGPLVELAPTITSELYTIPKRHVVRRHIQANYRCRCCEVNTSVTMPKRMFPGSSYGSPEFVADVAVMKYRFGMPLYRQVEMADAQGVPLNRTTLANLMIGLGDRLVALTAFMRDELLLQQLIHVDETSVQVLKEPGRRPEQKSYLWVYRSAENAERQIVLFDYQETRAGAHALNFLTREDGSIFNGTLHADGYAGYNVLSEVVRVACMAHIRRKFVDALKAVPAHMRNASVATEVIDMIGQLYGIERDGKGLKDEELLALRTRDSRPIVLRIEEWLREHRDKVFPKSALGVAIRYALDQWPAMVRYLDNAQSAIDNNIVEREIKRAVMGRKAWLFSDTPAGMHANAVLYSLVQTCLANGIDPYRYLVTVIEKFPAAKTSDDVRALLPWALKSELVSEPASFKMAA